jgi:PAS domain S-box-containing protein
MNVLIVDDQPINQKLLHATLEAEGHTVAEATNGVEALQLLESHGADAIISDILMPRMDGYRLCSEVRKRKQFEHLPFIHYTATYISPSDEKLSSDLGADVFLRKPAPAEEIIGALRRVTDKEHKVRATSATPESDVMKEYSERLVAKLEHKNLELVRALHELKSERSRLRYLLEHSPAVIYALKIQGQKVTPVVVSENIERLLGVTVAEATNEWWAQSLHPEDRDRALAVLANSLTEDGYSMEYRIRHKDGSYHWVEDNNRVVRDETGRPTESVGVWADITERKQAEVVLKESERRFREMLENVELIAMTLDKDGKLTFCNDYLLRVTGWTREEVMGADWFSHFIPNENVALKKLFFETIEAGEIPAHYENPIKTRTGELREIVWNNTMLRDSVGNIVGTASLGEDVTERKSTAETLERLRRQHELILNSAGEGIHGLDLEGKIVFTNPKGGQLLGWNANELLGKPAHATMHHTHADGSKHPVEDCPIYASMRDGGTRRITNDVFCRKDGSRFRVDYVCAPIKDEKGQIRGAIVTFKDITEQFTAEALQKSQAEQYRLLFETNPSPMWVFDTKSLQILAVNQAAIAQYGYSRDEFLKLNLKDLRPPGDVPDLMRGRALSSPQTMSHFSGQFRHKRKDESILLVEIFSGPVVWDGVGARIVTAIDVTERKEREGRLREQAKLLDLAQDAIMVRDMEDRVEFWNHGAEKLYGWTAAEVQGKKACGFLYKDDPAATAAARTGVIENGKWTGECKHTCKDGTTVMVRSRWTLVRDELAAPKSVLIINTDITEQKKLEIHLMRAQRLESIGTLASGVAHDLNNILAPILMCAEVLKTNPTLEDLPPLVSMIEESARRGANVVKQVFTFARGIEGERVVIKPSHLIQEMIDIAQQTFPKSIEMSSRYPEDLWSMSCDPTQLHQVLLNLSVNARDVMPNGGSLTIAAENFDVDEHYASMTPGAKPGPHVMFCITDTGAGMSRATIDKIFDPFFTTKEVGKGTGLGLSTVLGIVKSHSGFISVYSEIGKGTTFKIFLPAKVSEENSQESEMSPELLEGNGEVVLVIDDEPGVVQMTKMILEKRNYRVLTAEDGPGALAVVAQQAEPTEVVLTDMSMPFMDSIVLIRAIKKMKPATMFIASTGQGEATRMGELESLGVRNFLTKPYDTHTLLTTVRDTLGARNDSVYLGQSSATSET